MPRYVQGLGGGGRGKTIEGRRAHGGILQKSGVFPVKAGLGGKRALLPWGPLGYTSRRREVRATGALWRLKEEENRKQVNLSLLKNTSCRKFAKFIKVMLYDIFFRLQLTSLSCLQSSWCKQTVNRSKHQDLSGMIVLLFLEVEVHEEVVWRNRRVGRGWRRAGGLTMTRRKRRRREGGKVQGGQNGGGQWWGGVQGAIGGEEEDEWEVNDNKEEGDSNDKDEKEEKYKEGRTMTNSRTTTTRRSRRRFVKYQICFRHIRSLICSFSWLEKALWCCKADICVVSAGSPVPTEVAVTGEFGQLARVLQHQTPFEVDIMMICSCVTDFCNAVINPY